VCRLRRRLTLVRHRGILRGCGLLLARAPPASRGRSDPPRSPLRALAEREYGSFEEFAAEKARAWEGVGEPFLRELFSRKRERWGEDFLRWARKPEALALLCHERLAKLK
jgi:hypothetical protein